ncbi:extracellular solute-binding protein [Paenibacillus campi]|uniref:extracellular solute-binding protein n=1 Tax=Paenibacillus campi TaxID=3106031 RepID=UPI002AFFE843|nr:extracellular solute-binding protein [Paenibacillus sp. SGZ-1014]
MKKQSYKWAAGMLLSLSLFATACSSGGSATNSSTDSNSAASSSGNKIVKVAYGKWNDADVWGKWLTDVKTEFEKENPGVTVELQPIQGAQYSTKIPLLMSDPKTAPEVLAEDSFMINADSAAGYLEPLAVDQWSDWSNFNEGIKAAVVGKDGKSYGVPFSTDVRGLYYNKELFKKAGLPVPWQPKNWQDILTAAQTLKDKEPSIIPFWMNSSKAGQEATTMQTFEMLLYGTQNTLFENNKWVTQSPGVLNSLQFINNVYSKGLGAPLSQIMTAQAGQVLETDLMPNQKVGIVLNGSWLPSTWAPTGSKPWPQALDVYDFIKMPTENGQAPGYTSMSGGWTLAVGAKSAQKELGWKFIQMAVNKKFNTEYAILDSALTPRTDVAKEAEYLDQPGTLFAKAAEFLKYTHVRPSNSDYPVVSTAIQQMVEAVVTGGASPQQAMQQFTQSVTRSLGADKVAPATN